MKKLSLLFVSLFCVLLFSTTSLAQSVVINKYFNSGTTADIVELLVVQNNLDMRGMIIKDFSSNMANDGGGSYTFNNIAFWSSVPAGTLIVLRNDTSAADIAVGGGDFNLDIGLKNSTYFTAGGGTFDIATTEMVMIKSSGSGTAGVTGSIHALAGGTAGTQFTNAPTPKLRATGTSGTNQFVFANNTTEAITDFNGTDATGAATGLTFGSGNNAHNTNYINSLRNPTITEPTTQASNVTFNSILATSMGIGWTNGNGVSRIVLAKAGSPVDAMPSDQTGYTANAAFGSGSQIGTGNYVVFSGSGSSVNVTNLSPSTTYYFAVFEFNGSGATSDYLTTAPATGSQATAAGYTITGHVQNAGGASMPGVTLTLSGDQADLTTVTDAAGNYTFNNVTAGLDYGVRPSASSFSFNPTVVDINGLGSNQTADFTGTSQVIISEFRFHGVDPDGAGPSTASTNEYIELYNNSDAAVNITGSTLVTSLGDVIFTVPSISGSPLMLPARSHYLIAGTGYGLGSTVAANATFVGGTDIPDGAGVALFSSAGQTAGNRLDAVGFAGVADPLYREGLGLAPAAGVSTDGEYAFVRKLGSETPQDTNDNSADFDFVSTDAGIYGGRTSILGAPNPENLNSPWLSNGNINSVLIDGSKPAAQSPNRVRDNTPITNYSLGTLSVRRSFVNNTGQNVTQLRFRVIDITTLNSPGYTLGGPQADIRLISSSATTATVNGQQVQIQGTTLEEPPTQPNGGGMYSTVAAGTITTAAPLLPGQAANLQFLLGVKQTGTFRFYVNVEAVASAPQVPSEHLVMGNPSNAITDTGAPGNYLMAKPQYALSYNRDKGIPNWVSWHLDPSWMGGVQRQNDFRNDTTLPAGWYQVQGTDYSGSGFDRGHHCPSADRTDTIPDNSATFLMTNMMPQAPDNNQGPWEVLESYCRTLVSQGNELYIIAGGFGTGGSGSAGGTTNTIANGHVNVPAQTWKVIIVLPRNTDGVDDASRVTTSTRTIAVIMPNQQGIRNNDWHNYRVSVDQVEALTGFDFFSNVPVAIQNVIEAQVDNVP
jgi:endonuclease G